MKIMGGINVYNTVNVLLAIMKRTSNSCDRQFRAQCTDTVPRSLPQMRL